jgi:hypothetical protein
VAAEKRIGVLLSTGARSEYSLACHMVKVVGKPYEGKPHVRFEEAGGGNQDGTHLRRHPLTLQADGSLGKDHEAPQLSLSVGRLDPRTE